MNDSPKFSFSDEMYQELLYATPEAILIIDHQGKILEINHATESLFGYHSTEMVGLSIDVIVAIQFRNKYRQLRRAFEKDRQPRLLGDSEDLSMACKDGSAFSAEIRISPAGSGQGQIAVCAVRDISRRKHREHKLLEQSNRLAEQKSKLEAITAKLVLAEESERRRIAIGLHDDVGQTLAAAKMSLEELLEQDLPADSKVSAQESRRLVDHAIQSTRTLTFELASAALYELGLQAALQSVSEHAEQQSGIRFHGPHSYQGAQIPESINIILYRAGRELVRNIVKHSSAYTAKLSLSLNKNQMRLMVVDDGCGFDASATDSDAEKQTGFGLLSIAQQLVSIGGTLEVLSSPGTGTSAVIIVPCDPGEI